MRGLLKNIKKNQKIELDDIIKYKIPVSVVITKKKRNREKEMLFDNVYIVKKKNRLYIKTDFNMSMSLNKYKIQVIEVKLPWHKQDILRKLKTK